MTKIIKAIPNECVITLSFFKLEMEEMIEDAKKLRNITSFNLAQEIMSFLKDKKWRKKSDYLLNTIVYYVSKCRIYYWIYKNWL